MRLCALCGNMQAEDGEDLCPNCIGDRTVRRFVEFASPDTIAYIFRPEGVVFLRKKAANDSDIVGVGVWRPEWWGEWWAKWGTQKYEDALQHFLCEVMRHGEAPTRPEIVKRTQWPVYTSQEADLLLRMCGTEWRPNGDDRLVIQNSSHTAYIPNTNESLALAQSIDLDAILASVYIMGLFMPLDRFDTNYAPREWVDLRDVAAKAGLYTHAGSQDVKAAMRKVWDAIRFCATVRVCGERTSTYKDRMGNPVPTIVKSPIWGIGAEEYEKDDTAGVVPRLVELVMYDDWHRLLFDPALAQFIDCGHRIASIPGGKAGGAWARSVGTDVAVRFRKSGSLERVTRRDLLLTYPPTRAHPMGIIHRARVAEYWCDALQTLAKMEILDKSGECARLAEDITDALPTRQWLDVFLNEQVKIRPGKALLDAKGHYGKAETKAPKRRRRD